MKRYYHDNALALYNQGYKPIPIRPASKIPFMAKGESWQVEINKSQVEAWTENGKGGGGIALTGLCAIDCDIMDKGVSRGLLKALIDDVGSDLVVRIGQKPKFLIPCHPDSDIARKRKVTWWDKTGGKHEIEFLSAGDQYFLAYGIHPETRRDFTWLWDRSPMTLRADELKTWDSIDLAGLEDKFNDLCRTAGFTQVKPSSGGSRGGGAGESEDRAGSGTWDDIKPPGGMADPGGLAELAAWLDVLPAEWADDRDNWITIGAAIHHETGGSNEGWVVFDKWSQVSAKYKSRADTIGRWESFDEQRGLAGGDCVSCGTIIHVLKEAGVWKEAKKAGEQARGGIGVQQEAVQGSNSVSKLVKRMNQKHAIVKVGGKIRIMHEENNHEGQREISFLSLPDFNLLYSNKKQTIITDAGKRKQVSYDKVWIGDKNRREYKGVVFEPPGGSTGIEIEDYYNLWKGLSLNPAKGDWGLFRDHIYNVIADDDNEIGDWIISWVARIVQQPGGERPGTSIVLRGGQGTGKGVFVSMIGKLFGAHYMAVSHSSQVAGRFNSHLSDKVLVFIDEGFWAGDKQSEGVLKSIISEKYLAVEKKGVDIVQVKNNINLIMASNNDWVVPAGVDERRFFVLDISEKYQKDHKYFKSIINQMYKQGGLEAMLYDLLKHDFKKTNLREYKQTDGLFEQKLHSMSIELSYFYERLQEGDLLSSDSEREDEFGSVDKWGKILCDKQYNDYIIYSDKMKNRYPFTPTQFGIFIKKLFPGVRKNQLFYKGMGRKTFRYFPCIEKCREDFDKKIKKKTKWENQPVEDKDDLF